MTRALLPVAFFVAAALVALPGAAFAQTGPVGPADQYTPLQSGELFHTAHVLPDGGRQIRLSTLSHWGLTDQVQLDVGILGSLVRPQAGLEVMVLDGDGFDLSVAGWGETSWDFGNRTGRLDVMGTFAVGDYDRFNVGLGYRQGKVEVEAGSGDPPGLFYEGKTVQATRRHMPLRLSFDKVKSDRRVLRWALNLDPGPMTTGGVLEADGGVLWNYGWKVFRIGLGGGLRYAPSFGEEFNAALAAVGSDPIPMPNLLPKIDINLWWAF